MTWAGDAAAQGSGNKNLLLYVLVILAAVLLIGAIMQVADNLLRVQAHKHEMSTEGLNLWDSIVSLFGPPLPEHLHGKSVHILKAGYDIQMEGKAAPVIGAADHVTRYALQPPNYKGLAPIPKVLVEIGESVKAGQPLMFDKQKPDILYAAPVSGEVIQVNRGAKRAITEIVILADKEIQYVEYDVPDIESASREDLVRFLLGSGAWALIKQRPYDIVADPSVIPANIFISTFDSGPLAPDSNLIVQGKSEEFQKGLDVLNTLTEGTVYLGLDGRKNHVASDVFTEARGVEKHWFRGPHPCGNVGVQIHHIAPMSSAMKVWTLGMQEVITLGRLFRWGRYDTRRIVSLAGSMLKNPRYAETYCGANIGELLKDQISENNLRYISGDVLSGEQKTPDGYLNFYDDQLTVIREGNFFEMFGWLVPMSQRPSVSRSYPNFMFPDLKFDVNTNTHGEKRAFVMTGQYEQLLPMDLYPQHLMKAILANDVERMEGLGIYELSEEDVALCEFACTSKMPLQEILREGQKVMMDQS
jgi:Na+-transporting NADH:ubiquinone oxidoreductase subunit A